MTNGKTILKWSPIDATTHARRADKLERRLQAAAAGCTRVLPPEGGVPSATGDSPFVIRHSDLPRISRPMLRLFTWYSRRLLRRSFHSLRVSLRGMPPLTSDAPTVIFSNHASWWDPLVTMMLADEFFRGAKVFGPMDAKALERHAFFKKLGVFGVEMDSLRGAKQFIRTARNILRERGNILWMTPQGRFADARERPVRLKPGIGHLACSCERIRFLPVAIEYTFWEERLPEILVRFGQQVEISEDDARRGASVCTDFFARQLAETQDALAMEAARRNTSDFQCLLRGGAGVGGVYDSWRRLKAAWRGDEFKPEHGNL